MENLSRPWHILSFTTDEPDSTWSERAQRILDMYDVEKERLVLVLAPSMFAAWNEDGTADKPPQVGQSTPCFIETPLIQVLDPTPLGSINWETTTQRITQAITSLSEDIIPIVPGGVAVDSKENGIGLPVKGGAYTATVLARVLQADRVTFWGTYEGILSADPQYVSEAYTLPHLSYHEAAELGFHVQQVLHPKTLIPLRDHHPELRIRSMASPQVAGTYITKDRPDDDALAKAVTAQPDMALLVIQGLGMMGIPGVTAKAFTALAEANVNVVLLSQSANEQSVGICVRGSDKEKGLAALHEQFTHPIQRGDVERIYPLDPVGIVTVVDDHMRYRTGLTGKMFSTLGRSGINVLTIAEGASETNISAVVASEDLPAAVQALHEAFCFGRRRAHVFLFGVGTIGQQLLELMDAQSEPWLDTLNLKMCLVGLANSKRMAWNTSGIPFLEARNRLNKEGSSVELHTIIDHLTQSRLDRLIVIDATASNEIARCYPRLLQHNIAVVTPNKRANTLDLEYYDTIQRAARDHQVPYFYETTVGAGLPVISTLRDLLRSGDDIIRIEGIVSGTLAYLFNNLAQGQTFARALMQAYQDGYTEPDPRDDLSGEDVARKMLILAREMGLTLEREDIEIEPILPDSIFSLSRKEFLDNMETLLQDWKPAVPSSDQAPPGSKMHYIGRIESGKIRIRLQYIAEYSPFAQLHGTDNMIVFTTSRYYQQPLIIRGPGAGPAVTAGGVLADVIRAAELVT